MAPDTEEQLPARTVAMATPAGIAIEDGAPDWKLYPHLMLIVRALVLTVAGKLPPILLISLPPQHGKALHIDTPVMTTEGWKHHIDLKPGDKVFAPCGSPVKVMANTGAFMDESYEVEFSDHQSIIAGQAHEWDVLCDRDCKRMKCMSHGLKRGHRHAERLETRDLPRGYLRRRHQIPVCGPIQLPAQNLSIDPYLIGCWLGDGYSDMGYISCGRQDINHFKDLGEVTEDKPGSYRIFIRGLKVKLRQAEVLNNKHIPIEYLSGSISQRRSLLQGLMDTDGYCSPTGQCEFCTTNELLAHGAIELVQGLGFKATMITGRATLYGRDCGPKYRIMFTPDIESPAFKLPRKMSRQVATGPQASRRTIAKVSETGLMQVNCIQVEGGIYLAGRNLVATHNSQLVSQYFPAWFMSVYPKKDIILASYGAKFAASWGAKTRDVVIKNPEFLGIEVNPAISARDEWAIQEFGGTMYSVGAEGPVVGKGGNLGIIDDPHKGWVEVYTGDDRKKKWEWYTGTFVHRMRKGAPTIVVSTRWAQDDLYGRIKRNAEEEGLPYTEIRLPALAEENDPLGRAPGEALCPDLMDVADLNRRRKIQGAFKFSAVYQQNPKASAGDIFKRERFNYFRDAGDYVALHGMTRDKRFFVEDLAWFQTCDTAQTEDQKNDFTVVTTFAVTPDMDLLIYDVFQFKVTVPKLEGVVETNWIKWNGYVDDGLMFIGVENKNAGTGLIQGLKLKGIPVISLKADRNKELRAQPVSVMYENFQVYHRLGAQWLEVAEDELTDFPKGEFDDIVDTVSYGGIIVRDRLVSRPRREPTKVRRTGAAGGW